MDAVKCWGRIINLFISLGYFNGVRGIHLIKKNQSDWSVEASWHNEESEKSPDIKEMLQVLDIDEKQKMSEPMRREIKTQAGSFPCFLYPLELTDASCKYLVIVLSDNAKLINKEFQLLAGLIGICEEVESKKKYTADDNNRYRDELNKLREMQARLFPRFDNLKDLDAASVYLPADLMSGNFIDGQFLNDRLYQIVVCEITGYDARSSFAGAAIRTLLRSSTGKNSAPSVLIDTVSHKLSSILSGINSLVFLTIFSIDVKTGKTLISSYGDPQTIFYSGAKKGYALLSETNVGKNLVRRIQFRDIVVTLSPGDAIFYYSSGVIESSTEDGSLIFGKDRLIDIIIQNIDQNSKELLHTITDSIYDFTNYTQGNADMMMLCVKAGSLSQGSVDHAPAEQNQADESREESDIKEDVSDGISEIQDKGN